MEASGVVRMVAPLVQPLEDTGAIPNNQKCPLLIYPQALALPKSDPARVIERLLADNRWGGTWRNGIYPYHHYHSTAHEVLACYHGSAEVQLGGEPGIPYTMNAGDVIVIPAAQATKTSSPLPTSPSWAPIRKGRTGTCATANPANVPKPTKTSPASLSPKPTRSTASKAPCSISGRHDLASNPMTSASKAL